MNVKQLIEKYERLEGVWDAPGAETARQIFLQDLEQLDEPESGQADEAPRYVKNILARLRELPLHDREVWLKAIMGEFEQDFSCAKWREGYEQGKFEGAWVGNQLKDADKIRQELNKPVVPQFVADWYEENKDDFETKLFRVIDLIPIVYKEGELSEFEEWIVDGHTAPFQTLVNMHQFGYEVDKEKRYLVTIKGIVSNFMVLKHNINEDTWYMSNKINYTDLKAYHTKKELEEAGFGWTFDCEGIEIEEVTE